MPVQWRSNKNGLPAKSAWQHSHCVKGNAARGQDQNQIRDGAAVLGCLLPVFIDIMMDHPGRDWGQPYYPVVE